VRVLTEDDAYAIISGYIPVGDKLRDGMHLVSAICRQQRVLIIQLTPGDYAQYVAGNQRLTWEACKP